MNKYIYLVALFIFTGCANPSIEKRLLDKGEFVEAYSTTVSAYYGQKAEEKNKIVSEIMKETGGSNGNKFSDMIRIYLADKTEVELSFSYFPKVLTQARNDGLISIEQYSELSDLLLFQLEKASIKTPSLLENPLIKPVYPKLGRFRLKIAMGDIEKFENDPSVSLDRYFPYYKLFSESKEELQIRKVSDAMRAKVLARLKSINEEKYANISLIQPILTYVKLTDDRTFDNTIIDALNKIKFSRIDLINGDVPNLFPGFAVGKLEKNIISIDLHSKKDEFVVGEIIEELKKVNEWIDFNDESPRKINIGRIRFQENRTSPVNMTETVRNPSFTTLLMIPNNASVLFDYSESEYDVQWSMSMSDTKLKGVKSISGQRKGKKIECRNIRYQNVFGGIGSLNMMPNDAVATFCQSGSVVDFNNIRNEAIGEIAREINKIYFEKSEY